MKSLKIIIKQGFLFFLIFTYWLQSVAQEQYINFDEYDFKIPSNIVIDDIIDVRDEKNCIGYIFKGMLYKKTPVFLNKPIEESFKELIVKTNNLQENSEHLILRINKLIIYENVYSNMQLSICEMNVSFITKKNNKFYENFQAGLFIENYSQIDVSGQHSNNIIQALKICFEQYMDRKDSNKLSNEYYYKETDVFSNPLNNSCYPITMIDSLKKGIYSTFYDFRDFTPDTLKHFDVKYTGEKDDSIMTVIKGADGKKITDIWGFSDGKRNYIRFGKGYYSLLKDNGSFIIYDYPPDFESKIRNAQMIGGIFFTIIIAATEKKIKYSLDLAVNRFHPFDSNNDLMFESRIIVLSSLYNDKNKHIELIADNKKRLLKSGDYIVMAFNSDIKDVDICVNLTGDEVCVKSHPILFNTNLYLIKIKKKKVVILDPPENVHKELIKDINELIN